MIEIMIEFQFQGNYVILKSKYYVCSDLYSGKLFSIVFVCCEIKEEYFI